MTQIDTLAKDAYDKLADNIYIVCKGYFSMSRRLKRHNTMSQWTLSLLSVGLIFIPLLTVTKINLRYPQNVVDFASIALAVAVLVFSLLISVDNYAVRAEKAHDCGLELNELLRDMRYHAKDSDRSTHYKGFDDRYSDILKRYENYEQIDYIKAKISIMKDEPIPRKIWFSYWSSYAREILIYIVALTLEFGFIFLSLNPKEKEASQSLETTTTAVTDAAAQPPRQP